MCSRNTELWNCFNNLNQIHSDLFWRWCIQSATGLNQVEVLEFLEFSLITQVFSWDIKKSKIRHILPEAVNELFLLHILILKQSRVKINNTNKEQKGPKLPPTYIKGFKIFCLICCFKQTNRNAGMNLHTETWKWKQTSFFFIYIYFHLDCVSGLQMISVRRDVQVDRHF